VCEYVAAPEADSKGYEARRGRRLKTVKDLIAALETVPAKTEIFAHTPNRLYRVAKAKTLRTNLALLDDYAKDKNEFTTKFDGRVSRWLVSQIGTKDELL
jgi:hypothetical protein